MDHNLDTQTEQEPPGGWVETPRLLTNEILTLALCKWSGLPIDPGLGCVDRSERRHVDEPCITLYGQVSAILAGIITPEDLTAVATTVSIGGERTYRHDVRGM